jgi:hypothetical protein
MYSACKWLFKKCPNVIVLVAGLWIASLPPTFADYVVGIQHRRRIYGRFEAFLIYIHRLPLTDAVECVIFVAGCGIAIAGLAMMVRPWMNPRLPAGGLDKAMNSVNSPAPNPDAPPESN